MNDLKPCPERIWLIPDHFEGVYCHVWCDSPSPGSDMDDADATEYVRVDKYHRLRSEVGKVRDEVNSSHEAFVRYPNIFDTAEFIELIKAALNRILTEQEADSDAE